MLHSPINVLLSLSKKVLKILIIRFHTVSARTQPKVKFHVLCAASNTLFTQKGFPFLLFVLERDTKSRYNSLQ